jgi:hypothetical protein
VDAGEGDEDEDNVVEAVVNNERAPITNAHSDATSTWCRPTERYSDTEASNWVGKKQTNTNE